MTLIRPPRVPLIRALTLVIAVALGTSACGAGFDAATDQVKAPTNGSAGNVGNIAIRNLLLLQDEASPAKTTLIGAFANNSDRAETLSAISVSGAATIPFSALAIPGRGLVTPGIGSVPELDVPGAEFKPGGYAQVTLTFQTAGQITLNVLVMRPNGPSNGG